MNPDLPAPGGLDVLPDDDMCAEAILAVLHLVAAGRSRGPVRFVIASWWVGPRMPAPVTDRKRGKATRSGAWPHSPKAIEATRDANERGEAPKLVAEHVTLVGDLVEDLLRAVHSLDASSLAARLHAEHRFAVITPEEDKQLTDAGYEQTMPEGWSPGDDPWARYVESDLNPAEFAPLPDDVAKEASRLSTPDGRKRYKRRAAEEAAEAAAAAELADLHSDEDVNE